jgi:aryl-alcohol dehydrogenase-like predicted oxidoreductase
VPALPVIAVSGPTQLEELLRAADVDLDPEAMARLDAA